MAAVHLCHMMMYVMGLKRALKTGLQEALKHLRMQLKSKTNVFDGNKACTNDISCCGVVAAGERVRLLRHSRRLLHSI